MSQNLGKMLAYLRNELGLSLRKVEEETGISNAYLSQLERGIATGPSPAVLHKLAKCYNYSYGKLMELAGYIEPKEKTESNNPLQEAQIALMSSGLDRQQVQKVMEYVSFVQSQKLK